VKFYLSIEWTPVSGEIFNAILLAVDVQDVSPVHRVPGQIVANGDFNRRNL
jgi:hypothetical protein